MVMLTQGEYIKLMSESLKFGKFMDDYPYTPEEIKSYDEFNKSEYEKYKQDPLYKRRFWRRNPNQREVTQEEINEHSQKVIKDLISKRPKVYDMNDFINDADNFDPLENFNKSIEEIELKYKDKIKEI